MYFIHCLIKNIIHFSRYINTQLQYVVTFTKLRNYVYVNRVLSANFGSVVTSDVLDFELNIAFLDTVGMVGKQ